VWGACDHKIHKSVVAGNSFVEVIEHLIERFTNEEFDSMQKWYTKFGLGETQLFMVESSITLIISTTKFIEGY